jgi:hypothetical protein
MEQELARKNLFLGLVLLAIALVLFGGSVAVAILYNALS